MNELEQLTEVMIKDRKAITSSLNVAQVFHKRHTHVLRKIDQIKEDWNKTINSKTPTLKMGSINKNEFSPKMGSTKKRFKDHFKENTYIAENGRTVRSYDLDRFALYQAGITDYHELKTKLRDPK